MNVPFLDLRLPGEFDNLSMWLGRGIVSGNSVATTDADLSLQPIGCEPKP